MIPKFNSDCRRKTSQEEEADSVEGRFHEDMDENDEFRLFVRSMLIGLQDISTHIISLVLFRNKHPYNRGFGVTNVLL